MEEEVKTLNKKINELTEIIKKKDIIINDLIKKINIKDKNNDYFYNEQNNNIEKKKNSLKIMSEIMSYGIY